MYNQFLLIHSHNNICGNKLKHTGIEGNVVFSIAVDMALLTVG